MPPFIILINLIFKLTNCFLEDYADKKEKTQMQKTLESRLVERTEKMSNQFIHSELEKFNRIL